MAAKKKVGDLIREARTSAGLTQAALAEKVEGASASDIGKAERGEKELTQSQLKQIAKATGVTQKSLLGAPRGASGTSSKKTGSTAKKSDSYELTGAEKKLIDLYRAADSDTKKAATALLKGEKPESEGILSALFGTAADILGKK